MLLHRFNLIVNYLKAVIEVLNTIGVIKEVLKFLSKSVLSRKPIINIPLWCTINSSHLIYYMFLMHHSVPNSFKTNLTS